MDKLRTLREILGSLKRRKPTAKYCPKCSSPNIYLTNILWFFPERYVCNECGYEGSVTLEKAEVEEQEKPT